jgi:ABC-type polysaccharide/polyol phosphate transport system ATPase subunit
LPSRFGGKEKMTSTSNSNSTQSGRLIFQTKNLNFFYNLDFFRKGSFRDKFIDTLTNPLSLFNDNSVPHWVLRDVSLKIHEGERVGILGVNGTGKTTLCRCLAGMLTPASGELTMHGDCRAIFNTTVGLLPELTGRENAFLLSTLIYPELSKTEVNSLVEESLVFSELSDFVDVPYRNYSKGMQTRLFLSIISSRPSDLLIFDEVFDGADEFFQDKIATRFLNLMKNSGAVVFVSHVAEQIERTCTRVIVLHKEKVCFDGPVSEGIKFYRSIHHDPDRKLNQSI